MKALVTGASSGIGRDIAKELSNRGYELILVARSTNKMEELAKELKTKSKIITKDLSIPENCKELYEEVKDENIDILVNNAGFGIYGEFTETDLDKELTLIKTNMVAMHILMKLFLKDMKEKNHGKILNVASSAAFMPGPLMSTYYASKAYILRISQGIRVELKKSKSKVQISVLCPGPVKTNFSEIAGVKFGLHYLTSEYVARYAVKKLLKGKFIIVPGSIMKVIRVLAKIVPSGLASRIAYKINYTKKK